MRTHACIDGSLNRIFYHTGQVHRLVLLVLRDLTIPREAVTGTGAVVGVAALVGQEQEEEGKNGGIKWR